jgi:hypothetical protein
MNIRIKVLAPLAITLLLAACGGSDISGTYAETDSALKIKFDSGKAWVTGLTSMDVKQGTYEVDGDKITVDSPGHFHLVLTRNKDGTLHLDNLGGTLTKTDSGS